MRKLTVFVMSVVVIVSVFFVLGISVVLAQSCETPGIEIIEQEQTQDQNQDQELNSEITVEGSSANASGGSIGDITLSVTGSGTTVERRFVTPGRTPLPKTNGFFVEPTPDPSYRSIEDLFLVKLQFVIQKEL